MEGRLKIKLDKLKEDIMKMSVDELVRYYGDSLPCDLCVYDRATKECMKNHCKKGHKLWLLQEVE